MKLPPPCGAPKNKRPKSKTGPAGKGTITGDTVKTYIYEVELPDGKGTDSGEIEAYDEDHARRMVTLKLGLQNGSGIILVDKETVGESNARRRSFTSRYVLESLREHHAWLENVENGTRANLQGLDMEGLGLKDLNLAFANLSSANLNHADLRNAVFKGADLSEATLQGADMTNADFSEADLSGADLRDCILHGTNLEGADLWRANLRGAVISPEELHRLLACKLPDM